MIVRFNAYDSKNYAITTHVKIDVISRLIFVYCYPHIN